MKEGMLCGTACCLEEEKERMLLSLLFGEAEPCQQVFLRQLSLFAFLFLFFSPSSFIFWQGFFKNALGFPGLFSSSDTPEESMNAFIFLTDRALSQPAIFFYKSFVFIKTPLVFVRSAFVN